MTAHRPRTAVTLAGLVLAGSTAAVLAVVLALVALGAARPGRPLAVQDLVEVGVAGVGALTAAWLAVSCLLGAACVLGRTVGAQWRAAERAFRQVAPVVVRRAVAGAVGASLGLGLVATGAHAAPVTTSAAVASAVVVPSPTQASTHGPTHTPTQSPGPTTSSDAPGGALDVPVADGGAGAHDRGTAPVLDPLAVPDPAAPSLGWPTTSTPASDPTASGQTPDHAAPTPLATPTQASTPMPAPTSTPASTPTSTPGPDSPAPPSAPPSAPSQTPTPTPAPTPTSAPAPAPAPVAHDPVARPTRTPAPDRQVVVLRGDSLWSIAAAHLPSDATSADVAAAWPRWYEANRDVVGDDPDVLLPGQVLHVPSDLTLTTTDPTAATPAAPTTLEGR